MAFEEEWDGYMAHTRHGLGQCLSVKKCLASHESLPILGFQRFL